MRRRLLFWMASWLAIGMSACVTTSRPPQTSTLEAGKACAEWRWIGISRSGSRCPEISGWTVRPLFPQLAPVQEWEEVYCSAQAEKGKRDAGVPDLKLIRELNRFCVYEVAPGQRWTRRPSPPVSAGLTRIDQDCAATSLSASVEPASAEDQKSYASTFGEQAGIKSFAVPNPDGVRLAFLDTEPTAAEVAARRGRSPHGYTLAGIGQGLLCHQESCAARITTRLALPIISFDTGSRQSTRIDEERGGYMGLQSHLAEAIRNEVDAWRQDRQKGTEKHLVLNLSLAWDGELFGGLSEEQVSEMRAGTQAVYRALQYANGFDVLALAAAGNRKREPCSSFGPLLPAAWETGTLQEESCGGGGKTPLVYAVGGVRTDGHPLINARTGGMPRRAAYGENAPVAPYADETPAVLTGSSISTAVVSSIAAAVWSSFPELSSREVMATLDTSGDELPYKADFWFGEDVSYASLKVPSVHRLSLCSALQAAWSKWGPSSSYPSPLVQGRCGNWKWEGVASKTPKNPVWDSCQPWAHPQPETPPCMACGGSNGGYY